MDNCKQTNIPVVDNSDDNCCFTATDECITTTNALPTIGTAAGDTLETVLSELDTYIGEIQVGIVSWGSITGDINNQTDLIGLLDLKANDDEVVKSVNSILPDAVGNVDITYTVPSLQEVTTQGNISDNALLITGMDNLSSIEEGLIIANTPGNSAIIGYNVNSLPKGNIIFSETESGFKYPSTSLGSIGVIVREEGTLIQGIVETSVSIPVITAGPPRTLITKEYADATYAGGGGVISSIGAGTGITIDNTNPSIPIVNAVPTDLSNYVTIDTPQTITAFKSFTSFTPISFGYGIAFSTSEIGAPLQGARFGYGVNHTFRFIPQLGQGDVGGLDFTNLTSEQDYTFPDKSGTVALLSDITSQNLQEVLDTGNTFESAGTLNGIQGVNSGSGSGIYIETNADGESITSNATATATGYHFVGNREGITNFSVDVDGNIETSGSIEAEGNVNILGSFNGNTVSVTGGIQSDFVQTNNVDTGQLFAGTGNFTGIVKGITPVAPEDLATKQYVDDNSGGGGTNPDWSNITNTPTTLAGYGITDSYTQTESQDRFLRKDINTTKVGDLTFGSATVPMSNVSFHTGDTAFSQYNYDAGFLTHRRSGGGVFSGWKWSTYTTDQMMLNSNGVLEVNNVVKASDPVAPEDLTTKAYVDSAVGSVASANPKISFIFDDGYNSHRDVVKPIFDARGIKGGIAITNRLIEAFQRLRADEIQDFQKDGWEILGHSVNHETMNPASVGIGYKRVEAEVKLNIDQLEHYGYNIDGWVTPSSIMDDSFIPALHNRFNYGFTKSNGANPIQDYSDRYKLTRFALEANTLQQAQDAADAAAANSQDIIYYTHDVPAGSQKEADLIALIDYCIAQGYEITTPREALKQRYDFQDYDLDEPIIIHSDINSISLLNATETTTNGVMTVTPDTATTTVLAQSSVPLPDYIKENTQLSFSIDMKLVTGITPICSIGIQFKDSGGAIIRSDEEGTFEMSSLNLRYYVTNNIPEGTTLITYFVRLIPDNDATTTFELKEPLLSTGDNIRMLTQVPVQAADADTLQGISADQFLRSDIDTTKIGGNLSFSENSIIRFGAGATSRGFIQQASTNLRLSLNDFNDFRITNGSTGSIFELTRTTGNLWVPGQIEAAGLNLNGGTSFDGILDASGIQANRNWVLPNESGTLALTSAFSNYYDIPASNGRFMKIASNETITGLKTYTSGSIFRSASPNIRFEDTDGGLNEKNTMIRATGDVWELLFYRDDYSINTAAIRIERTGEQSTNVLFNTPRMDIAGDVIAAGDISGGNMTLTGELNGNDVLINTIAVKSMNSEPASATAAGTLGEMRVTANYIYVCTATNTWKRTPLTTW